MEDLITWADIWEKTMTVAKNRKGLETKTSIWFQDFSYDTGSLTNVGGSIWDRTLKPRTTLLTTEKLQRKEGRSASKLIKVLWRRGSTSRG
jgi:hypothetical protein